MSMSGTQIKRQKGPWVFLQPCVLTPISLEATSRQCRGYSLNEIYESISKCVCVYSFVHLHTLMHLEWSHMYCYASNCDVFYMFCTCTYMPSCGWSTAFFDHSPITQLDGFRSLGWRHSSVGRMLACMKPWVWSSVMYKTGHHGTCLWSQNWEGTGRMTRSSDLFLAT